MRASTETSGRAGVQRVYKYLKEEITGKKKPEVQKTNLGTCCGPQKAPGAPTKAPRRDASGCPACSVQNKKVPVRRCRYRTKFRAKNCALNPKLGDWEDIYNLERVRTGIDLKSYEVCATYHNIVVGIMPRGVKFFDRAPQPAKVLPSAPGAGRINHRQLVLPQAARR